MKHIILIAFTLPLFFSSCSKDAAKHNDEITVIKSTGDISTDLEKFRELLGPLNSKPGTLNGRREISWDGVPDSLENKNLPGNFFNQTGADAAAGMQRGLVYNSTGKFMVSSNGFATINSNTSAALGAFSGAKTFSNVAAAKWDVKFQQAATTKSAYTNAFGAVFLDVDKDSSAFLEYFDGDKSLGKYFVPAHTAQTNLSFLGVRFNNTIHITKVTVNHDGFLSQGGKDISDGGAHDFIALDDFIYAEPVVLP